MTLETLEHIRHAPETPAPVGPYSQAVKYNGIVFCAGQVGLHPTTNALAQGIEAQTQQVLENLKHVLASAGTSFKKALLTTVFLSDIQYTKTVNEIYSQYVNCDAPPARQTVAVRDLPLGALVEISVIAGA